MYLLGKLLRGWDGKDDRRLDAGESQKIAADEGVRLLEGWISDADVEAKHRVPRARQAALAPEANAAQGNLEIAGRFTETAGEIVPKIAAGCGAKMRRQPAEVGGD